jgi:streptogramin lyase
MPTTYGTRDIWWKTGFLVVPSSSRTTRSSSSKKIIAYAIIGIVAVAAVSVSVFARPPPPNNPTNEEKALQTFKEVWCGVNPRPNSNTYISEVVLPSDCQMPVGIAVDGSNNQVWYVSAKRGVLGSYSIADNKFSQYNIPEWPSREQPFTRLGSWGSSWTIKFDKAGNVWFTDQNNALWRFNKTSESFDMFKVPASYPSAMDFDSSGNIYFIGIDSKSLYFGDVSKMKGGTSEGFTEIPLPLDGFSGVDPKLLTSGALVVDNERKDVWVSLLVFQAKGQIFRYDINTGKVDRTVDLPAELSSPVGAAIDNSGNLWVADHGTSIFFKYDPAQDKITKFVTSVASPKIYGGKTPANAYTLPYWLATGQDGSLWFNEHFGNKIARFDPETLTLTEYWIPSQNKNWAACPPGSTTCGIANALQFGLGPDNQAWFSEMTENKIAKLDAAKQVPITVSAPDEVTVAKGDSTEIRVMINASGDFSGKMTAAGTFTPNGMLGNSTGIFSEESVSISGGSKQVSYTFTPAEDLAAGQYVIMIGAGNDDVSVLKAVRVNVV